MDIVDVASAEVGYTEQGSNRTKYGAWYGANGCAWCHIFVSYCANKADVPTSVVPKTASCDAGMRWFKSRNLFKARGSYTPSRGDIVYFGTSHAGIVESVSGNTVHTIEGNSSNKVARRSYPLSNSRITGYGTPKYTNLSTGTTGNSSGNTKKTGAQELAYLKKVLSNKKKKTTTKAVTGTVEKTNALPDCVVRVLINNGKKIFELPVKDGMKLVWERKGNPGKLTFEAKYDKNYTITEGNSVRLEVDGNKMFYGYVFTRQRQKDGFYSYTVYDQLRYLKNKETMVYKNKRADQVIKMIATRFNLKCGKLANTGYTIKKKIEDNTTLFDIVQNAIDETMMSKDKIYVLFDECGKLRLKNIADMKVNGCLIDDETAEDFTYKTSIDSNVYNIVRLLYEDSKTGTYRSYVAKSKKNMAKWGNLQYLDKVDDPAVGNMKAKAYLKLYNQKERTLSLNNCIGNTKVRAGCLIPIILDLDDVKVANYMIVEKVTHKFENHNHRMDLVVSGGGFSAE